MEFWMINFGFWIVVLNFLINLNKKKEMKQNLIQDKSFNFSILSIELYKELSKNKEFIISKQFLRSQQALEQT